VVVALLAAGCEKDYPNPFGPQTATKAPPAGAAIVFTSNGWSTTPGSGRELFSIGADGSNPTRLTFCNTATEACDTLESSLSPESRRAIQRRARADVTGAALVYTDLARAVETDLLPAGQDVQGIDWAPSVEQPLILYSARGEGGLEDIWRADPNGANAGNLTSSATVRERRCRVDPLTRIATYERLEGSGKAEVFVFVATNQLQRVTPAGPGGAALPGTPYLVGSDTDPAFSPDGLSVVFRRLTATDAAGVGTWDIMTATSQGASFASIASFTTIATGPRFRGAPDWGPNGIIFPEVDVASGTTELVLITPAGQRRVLYTQGSRLVLSSPRWLRSVVQ
jgi:Tol biopolymer transport system component